MRRMGTRMAILAVILAAWAFFGWHARYGARSFAYQAAVQERLKQTRARLEAVRTRRKQLEERNALLRSESLDPDMLDEMARRMLGFAGPGEQITLLAPNKAKRIRP